MIGIIKRHNRLNGVTFAIVEFSFIALVVGTFAALYVIRGKNPNMLRDTLLLTTANLLPFVVLVAVLFETYRRS